MSLGFFTKNEKNFLVSSVSPEELFTVEALESDIFDDPWSLNQWKSHIGNNGVLLGCFYNEELVAYISGNKVLDEVEIYRLAVKKKYRREGIAAKLLDYFYHYNNLCDTGGTVFLEVRASNPAVTFYTKQDFEQCGLRKAYYKDGEDCLLMKRNFFVEG